MCSKSVNHCLLLVKCVTEMFTKLICGQQRTLTRTWKSKWIANGMQHCAKHGILMSFESKMKRFSSLPLTFSYLIVWPQFKQLALLLRQFGEHALYDPNISYHMHLQHFVILSDLLIFAFRGIFQLSFRWYGKSDNPYVYLRLELCFRKFILHLLD